MNKLFEEVTCSQRNIQDNKVCFWLDDDVIPWKRFSHYWPFVEKSAIPSQTVSDAELWCCRINSRLVDDMRRHVAHAMSLKRYPNVRDHYFKAIHGTLNELWVSTLLTHDTKQKQHKRLICCMIYFKNKNMYSFLLWVMCDENHRKPYFLPLPSIKSISEELDITSRRNTSLNT